MTDFLPQVYHVRVGAMATIALTLPSIGMTHKLLGSILTRSDISLSIDVRFSPNTSLVPIAALAFALSLPHLVLCYMII